MYRSNDTIKDLNLLDIVSRRCCINNPPLVRYESQRIVSNCNSFKFYDPSHTLRKIELNFFVIPTHSWDFRFERDRQLPSAELKSRRTSNFQQSMTGRRVRVRRPARAHRRRLDGGATVGEAPTAYRGRQVRPGQAGAGAVWSVGRRAAYVGSKCRSRRRQDGLDVQGKFACASANDVARALIATSLLVGRPHARMRVG